MTGSVVEANGTYTMTVASSDGFIAAELVNLNSPPNKGPNNSVEVMFSSPVSADVVANNVVFRATGG